MKKKIAQRRRRLIDPLRPPPKKLFPRYVVSNNHNNNRQGRDKYENENLIAHALPHDIWFHVEDMSSAHVYLRPPSSLHPPVVASAKPGKGGGGAGSSDAAAAAAASASAPSPSGRSGAATAAAGDRSPSQPLPTARAWHEIPSQVLADCCQLVKHNSISGSKAAAVDVVYTPAPNLLKNDRMDTGQVRGCFFFLFACVRGRGEGGGGAAGGKRQTRRNVITK